MKKIFIIEDDIKIQNELSLFLQRNGYKTQHSNDFKNIIQLALDSNSDLILLDINLPFNDGYFVCKEIRKVSQVPIIIVTSKNTELDELMSMNFGADDFITKPYNTQILLARVDSVLRRANISESTILSYNGITLDLSKLTIANNNENIELTKNEIKILHILFENKGNVISRTELIEELWQSDEFVDDNTLTVNINRIRKKLELIGLYEFIKTKRGLGYII